MPKRFVVSDDGSTEKLATLLFGSKARVSEIADVSLDLLLQRTQEQLNGAARLLGLSGLSRSKKKDLARRVQTALRKRTPAQQAPAPPSRQLLAPGAGTPRSHAGNRVQASAGGVPPPGGSHPRGSRSPRRALAPSSIWAVGSPRRRSSTSPGLRQNRITAVAVDPRRMYAYWEIRDDAIAATRAALGRPAGTRG